jgi:hypothetical protein
MGAERDRLRGDGDAWKRWGPYVSDRAWGTVREDYSADGDAWHYFPHDAARSRAYRWNEDGIAGICDQLQRLCFAVTLWNGKDPILKERLFGLSGPEGNHGEDVKEAYFYLDSTPTHSYMKMLYKYPHAAFPYSWLVEENGRRTRLDPEFELLDTGIFDEQRYFDVFVEYAKAGVDDILIRLNIANRGPDAAEITVLPTIWFRNTWSWYPDSARPLLSVDTSHDCLTVHATQKDIGSYLFWCEGADELVFTENVTNSERLFGTPNLEPHVKDAFDDYVVHGRTDAVNHRQIGTKAAAIYRRTVAPGATVTLRLRLSIPIPNPFAMFDETFALRIAEADQFYAEVSETVTDDDLRRIQRQAFAGMLWCKQYYHYNVDHWLRGDPLQPAAPSERRRGRNSHWTHLTNGDVISMPDKWEYPWYATWDLAFHCVTLAAVDCDFAKCQLELLLREWYQHPNGQVPAYEWAFDDVNPPVFAWAAWRIYRMDKGQNGGGDIEFLEGVFHKLLLNFTWWVNRKDSEGNNIFQGGFLGLDNIGVFDRSAPLPTGGYIEQSDGTSWMGMFCLNMLTISLSLAQHNPAYEDIASKFFDHFLFIAGAMQDIGGDAVNLWDEEDQFFYDVLRLPEGQYVPLRVRSFVGLIPLFAVTTIEEETLRQLPAFAGRLEWFLQLRPDLASLISRWHDSGAGESRQLALVRGHRLKRLLRRALDPNEFLSDYGLRGLSKYHRDHPYTLPVDGTLYTVNYEPGESRTGTFGGNSNWRGPVWFPLNYLLIEALLRFHHYYGDDFVVECPTGSGNYLNLRQISNFLAERMVRLFTRDQDGNRPFNGTNKMLQNDPHWKDYVLFHEFFHGDTGLGLGASHQTGWTGLVARLIQQVVHPEPSYGRA